MMLFLVMDTIGHGSMGVRFGARISLPFYTQLRNLDEAIEYCKSNLKVLNFIGEPVRILWDSNVGTEIAKTFVLGEQVSFVKNAYHLWTKLFS